jgi:hypothetical protein
MKFIILVSKLKEISPSVFSWKKKRIYQKYDAILLLKYDSAGKKILNYAYVLKNGVDRYNIFFFIFTQSWILLFVSFSYIIRKCFIQFHDSIQCAMCFFVNNQFRTCKRFPEWIHCQVVWICAGQHWILYGTYENQTTTYFLRSRLFTYDIMKNFNCN